jgi:hypothetical protein
VIITDGNLIVNMKFVIKLIFPIQNHLPSFLFFTAGCLLHRRPGSFACAAQVQIRSLTSSWRATRWCYSTKLITGLASPTGDVIGAQGARRGEGEILSSSASPVRRRWYNRGLNPIVRSLTQPFCTGTIVAAAVKCSPTDSASVLGRYSDTSCNSIAVFSDDDALSRSMKVVGKTHFKDHN